MKALPEHLNWWNSLSMKERNILIERYEIDLPIIGLGETGIKNLYEKELGTMEKKFTSEETKEIAKKMFWLGFEKSMEIFYDDCADIPEETKTEMNKLVDREMTKALSVPKTIWEINKDFPLYRTAIDMLKGDWDDEERLRITINGFLSELEVHSFIPKGSFFTVEVGEFITIKRYY